MRQLLTWVVLLTATGCGGSSPGPVVCTGDVTIASSAELAAFADRGCESVAGDLTITGVTSVELPALSSIGGSFHVDDSPALTRLSLPALTSVTGDVSVANDFALETLDLPALASVSGRLALTNDAALSSLDLLQLTMVSGALDVAYDNALTTLSLPALSTVGGFRLWIQGNRSLGSVDLPALTVLHGALAVVDNSLADLSLPVLTTIDGALQIQNEVALTTFSFPALSSLGGDFLAISGNPALPQCLAVAFRDHVVSELGYAGASSIVGNDDAATCE